MREFLTLLVILLSAGAALASNPEVEQRIEAQDRLHPGRDRAELLNRARKAVSESDTAMNRYLLGRAYGLTGQFEEAREQFDWAIERDPSFAYSYHGLGVYEQVKGNPDEAIRQFRTALRLDPHFNRAHADLGKILLQKGEPLAAEREFQEVLRTDPDDHGVRILLSQMYLRDRRYDRAIQELQVVLAKDPGNLPARKLYAVALSIAKRGEEAIREFERYLKDAPKDFEAYVFLQKLHLDEGDKEAAIAVLERLRAAAPKDAPWQKEAEAEIQRIREGRPEPGAALTFEGLLARLDSKDVKVRRETMRSLCDLDFYRLPKRMVQAVTDPDNVVRAMVVRKLGEVSREDALPLLEILLLSEKDRDGAPAVRAAAARGITISGTPAAIPILVAALDDESEYVFRIAATGLRAASGLSFTEKPLPALTANERAEVAAKWREWWAGPRAFSRKLDAIDALLDLDFKRGRRFLADLIADAEKPVAIEALRAFVRQTGKVPGTDEDLDTADGRGKVRERALAILAEGN